MEALAGEGETWRTEIADAGSALSEALVVLGDAVAKDRSASSRRVGDVLERLKRIEKLSLSQKAAVRKVIMHQMKQMRDARRELAEAAAGEGEEELMDDDDDDDDFGGAMDDESRARASACDAVLAALDAWWTAIVRESPDDVATLDALAKLARRFAAAVDATVAGIQLGETEDSGDLAGVVADLTALIPPPAPVDVHGVFAASE